VANLSESQVAWALDQALMYGKTLAFSLRFASSVRRSEVALVGERKVCSMYSERWSLHSHYETKHSGRSPPLMHSAYECTAVLVV
jgi:hypothetical protein